MMKACLIRVWLPAAFAAGVLLGMPSHEVAAQAAISTTQAGPNSNRKVQLAQAARLADLGKYAAAMAIYREVFGSHPPPGDLAIAYYETEAGTDDGRGQAEEGLRGLAHRYPSDARYQISLGRILTYDPATRDEGRTFLAMFPGDPKASEAFRQSLVWDAANPAVGPQIRVYLAAHSDPQLAALYRAAQPAAATIDAVGGADKASAHAVDSVRSSDRGIVVTPASSRDAVVALQTTASQSAPASPGTSAVQPVISPRTNPLATSVAADQAASKVESQIKLAATLLLSNDLDRAAAIYKQVISEHPDNVAAWEGLVRLQSARGQEPEALETIQRMPGPAYATAMHTPDFEVAVASIYERLKKLDTAQNLLQKAVTDETSAGEKPSPEIEMQLAKIYAERGNPQLAYPVYQQVLRENPERADAWAGLLSALHVTGHDKEAVAQVALIPTAARAQLEENQSYLQTMAEVHAHVEGNRQPSQAQEGVDQRDGSQEGAAEAEIQRAWLLYNGMNDVGLYAQLMRLGGRSDLTVDQRRAVQTIWTKWALRRADQAVAARDQRSAVPILNAARSAFSDNPGAMKLVAAAYLRAGQPHEAFVIWKAQDMATASSPEYEAAVSAALADRDNKDAENWLHNALARYPADSQILILAARLEQALGDTTGAIRYYRASLKAMPPAHPGSKLASELGLPTLNLPSTLPSIRQPQDLSVLLAPGYVETPQTSEQPYLPYGVPAAPLPPYDGRTQLQLPPGTTSGSTVENAARTPKSADVASAALEARTEGRNQTPAAGESKGSAVAEVYSPYVPYVPTPTRAARSIGYQPQSHSIVTVQLGGNDIPHPVHAQPEMTDVLPTARYGPSAIANQAAASHDQVAAARAERIRRLREDGVPQRSGQSHPPPDDSLSEGMQDAQYRQPQVARPSVPPSGYGAFPDTGAQQYPQPAAPPGSGRGTNTRIRMAPHVSAGAPHVRQENPVIAAPQSVAPAPAPGALGGLDKSTHPLDGVSEEARARAINPGTPLADEDYPPPSTPPSKENSPNSLLSPDENANSQAQIPVAQRQQTEDELASLEGSYSGWLGIAGIARYRSGVSGLDRLYDLESPAEASVVFGREVRVTAVAEPVFLNSGSLNPASITGTDLPYLGTTAATAAGPRPQQFANGLGGELQLTAKHFGLAVGYTPYEFPVRNITARFLWNTFGNHVSLFGDRQPVKDTQLSFAGLHDPAFAGPLTQSPIWGGVVATTGGLRLQFGDSAASLFVSGDGGVLTGRHVLDNYRFKGAIGSSFRLTNWASAGELRLDAIVSGMHNQHDEIGLSYGQGGYFSPDLYFLASLPVTFNGHYKTNFHYTISGAAGVQTFQQNAAPFYPLDPGLQAALVSSKGAACTSALAATYVCGQYPLVSSTEFSYTFNSEASYQLADHWYGGAFLSANNSSNFDTVSAGFFFRYVFRKQLSQKGYPAGLFHVEGLRSLQIP